MVTARTTTPSGTPLSTFTNLRPDWIALRVVPAPDSRPLAQRVTSAPSSHAFGADRFSNWQAVVLRRDPDGAGSVIVQPDADPDGVPRVGVSWDANGIAVGGHRNGPVGITAHADDPTASFRICVCDDAVTEHGDSHLVFDAMVGGTRLESALDVT